MKKIGIDLRGLQTGHEFRGIGIVIRSVVEELFDQGLDKNYDVIFYHYNTSDPLRLLHLPEKAEFKKVVFNNPKKPSLYKAKSRRAIDFVYEIYKNHFRWSPVPKTARLSVFVQFDQQLGLPKNPFIKKILYVHDLIPLVYRRQYLPSVFSMWRKYNWRMAFKTAGFNLRYKLGFKQIRKADRLIAISENTKEDIVKFLRIKEKKITVIYIGGPHKPSDNPPDLKRQTKFADSYRITSILKDSEDKPYIMFIGGPEPPRRRLDHLVTAYHHLRAEGRNIQLVFVGKELGGAHSIPSPSTAKMVQHLSYRSGLHLLGYVSDEDVNRLYEHALCFVFPSLYEGFGLPILEAMERNCPVIAYNNSSIAEVGDRALLMIEPGYKQIKEAVELLLDNPNERERLKRAGRRQARKFSWAKSAKGLIEILDNL